MEKAKVYFTRIDSYAKTDQISASAQKLLEKVNTAEQILDFAKPIPIKVHFGEEGCTTYIEPKNFEGITNYLKNKSKAQNTAQNPAVFYTDSNVLYKGRRTTKEEHTALAKEHNFTQLPVIIADGEAGEENIEIDISKSGAKHFTKCKISKAIAKNEQLIVLAHFKGHILSGFGGAIKQLSMGCASRPGKLAMHSNSKPIINPLKCKKCNTCANNCPSGACIIQVMVPHIDKKKCIGCAKCIAVCPYGAVDANWISTLQGAFNEKLAEYALAAQQNKKVIYVNFIFNVTKECDCMDKAQKVIAKDIGVVACTDPVALDRASLDLLSKNEGRKIFSGEKIFSYAQKIGLGNFEYELIEVN